jgi:hypothetical protein
MPRDLAEEITLLDLSRAQRQALAARWPLILTNAGEAALAEEIRRELTAEPETLMEAA